MTQISFPDTARAERSVSRRRETVLLEAQKQFLARGFSATTVDVIAKCARISKRDFYALFSGREAVFLEVAKRLAVPRGSHVHSSGGSAQERMAGAAFRIRAGQLRPEALGIFRAAISVGRLAPDLAREVYHSRTINMGSITDYLEERSSLGLAAFDDPLLAALRFGFLATEGLRHLVGLPLPDLDCRKRQAEEVADVFLNGHATARLRGNRGSGCSLPGQTSETMGNGAAAIRMPVTRLSDEQWDRVCEVAWGEFRQHGYEKASMAVIAHKSGLPKNTIYRRFKSKAGIFTFSCRAVIDQAFRAPLLAKECSGPIREHLIGIALSLQTLFCAPDMAELHRLLIVEAGRAPEDTSAVYEHLVATVERALSPLIAAMVEAGLMKPELQPSAAWRFYVLATFGSRFLFMPPGSPEEALRHSTEAVDQFLYGIARD